MRVPACGILNSYFHVVHVHLLEDLRRYIQNLDWIAYTHRNIANAMEGYHLRSRSDSVPIEEA